MREVCCAPGLRQLACKHLQLPLLIPPKLWDLLQAYAKQRSQSSALLLPLSVILLYLLQAYATHTTPYIVLGVPCLEDHGSIVRRGAIGGVPRGGRCGTHGAVDGGGVLHAGDETSVGAMGRNPMTFPRRAPLKACSSPGLCPIGVGVLQACAPLKLHVILVSYVGLV